MSTTWKDAADIHKGTTTLTLYGCSKEQAEELYRSLTASSYNLFKVAEIVTRYNIRCTELDKFARMQLAAFDQRVREIEREAPEWLSGIENQEQRIQEIENEVLIEDQFRFLPYSVKDLKPVQDKSLLFDWDVVDKYGWDVLLMLARSRYLPDRVYVIESGQPYRETAERATALGLSLQGESIGIARILERLSMEDLKEIAADFEHKSFRKKADAIDFITNLPEPLSVLAKLRPVTDYFLFHPIPETLVASGLNEAVAYREYCLEAAKFMADLCSLSPKPVSLVWKPADSPTSTAQEAGITSKDQNDAKKEKPGWLRRLFKR